MTPETQTETAFLHRYVLDGKGKGFEIDGDLPEMSGDEILWVHLDVNEASARDWLNRESGLDPTIIDALLAAETRPRSHVSGDGMLVVLRGVNMNPGEDPEDMVSIRLWIEPHRIISTRRRPLVSISDLRDALSRGKGPKTSGGLLSSLTGRLADRIGDFVDKIEDRVSELESPVDLDQTAMRESIAELRREIAQVRRFLAPQRDALDRLYRQPGEWFSREDTEEFREEADRITRYLEDLDLARERTSVLREEFLGQIAQEQNARMYVLSVVAAIFLPLTFVTGLLGMNVGGLPGVDDPQGFIISIVVMIAAAIGLAVFFRWKRWF
jgi:zinc transporter